MKLKKILMVTGIAVVIVILAAFACMAFVFMDGMSYLATGSETLSPAGNVTGNALVVYDPGITGNAKNAAVKIADDLQAKGYVVELAGVRSAAAANESGYDVVVAGGPIYAGNVSSSISEYMKALTPNEGARLGVFAIGSTGLYSEDTVALRKQVAAINGNAATGVVRQEKADRDCSDFVSTLLQ